MFIHRLSSARIENILTKLINLSDGELPQNVKDIALAQRGWENFEAFYRDWMSAVQGKIDRYFALDTAEMAPVPGE